MAPSLYDAVKGKVNDSSTTNRVEVNQRALIDKILARYASAGAVYRELLQNSNDAEATRAEISFTTNEQNVVTQVQYKNNGMSFRPQDWDRLQKIAEGNPDEKKVGAFGVGAYTMFSICEEPMVISGNQALLFFWKGDALWTRTAEAPEHAEKSWTTFILPSRDPYPMQSLTEFGQFLCASLTFTQCLKTIRVLVNDKERLVINKSTLTPPRVVNPPKSSSFWKNDGAITQSPSGLFSLQSKSILEEIQQVSVLLDDEVATIMARYVSGTANTTIPHDMVKRMERVTKKKPPKEVTVQIYINAEHAGGSGDAKSEASKILSSFSPKLGAGRVFIGFRTSQTTGLAAHLAAPLIPTVEREAIDLQDPTLRIYNTELLEFSGILMRLTLEHSMSMIGDEWVANAKQREALEAKLLKEGAETKPEQEEVATLEREESTVSDDGTSSSSSLMSFAKFMARGVKKKVVHVMSTVENIVDDGSAELLNPRDPRPLSAEERHAILLMQSFCPQQSTPDTLVGTALAQGFSRCMPNILPPVLTKSGVLRGNDARLPHRGIEAFLQQNVVRQIVYQNAEEYHEVLARCRRLNLEDLTTTLVDEVIDEDKVVRLLKWWTKFSRLEPNVASRGIILKNSVSFLPKNEGDVLQVKALKEIRYYVDHKVLPEGLPMPDSVLPAEIQEAVTTRTLSDSSLASWFTALPVERWAEYICSQPCMVAGQPEDEMLRTQVLSTLSKEYASRYVTERVLFGSKLNGLLSNKRCLPFDSQEPTNYAAACPGDLYLNSAELKAFDGIGSFNKVAQSLMEAGVTEEFLLALGVRKSIAIDFLFTNLETLRWRDDPKPLIEYLRSAILTRQDLEMLRTTQYLPAENDLSRTFAPSELYLPNQELRVFPFVRLLQWPSEDELTERTASGKFLTSKLGSKVHPPLLSLLRYVSKENMDDSVRVQCLDYVVKNLGPGGVYESDYMRVLRSKEISNLKFLPCVQKEVLTSNSLQRQVHSPTSCYSDQACMIMGFPVLNPETEKKNGRVYGTRFHCERQPDPSLLLSQLLHLVAIADARLQRAPGDDYKKFCHEVVAVFDEVFKYLSTRSTEFSERQMNVLKKETFIPCMVNASIEWYDPTEVYFKNKSAESEDTLTEELFHVIDFSPFLAAAGVQSEARTQDIFRLMLSSPDKVLKTLGSEAKYRTLLRRIAANPPFNRVTPEIRNSAFLLAYKIEEDEKGEGKSNYLLAKAEDIYIIDNSFFGRMFPVIRAPHESDLEDFYHVLGSSYISKEVKTTYEVIGFYRHGTSLTKQLGERIKERSPLLVSPSVTSRPLVSNAASFLDDGNLNLVEADDLKAVYSLGKSVRNQRVTSCTKSSGMRKNSLYITEEFDWFDIGSSIGGLILERCQLEDAFFIGSLLEAPIAQLRSRGFPVDRILRPPEPLPPPKPAPVKPVAPPKPSSEAAPRGGTVASPAPATSNGKASESQSGGAINDGGFEDILQQMFPDCLEGYIRARLGPNPSMDDVRSLAEEMATGGYPKPDDTPASIPEAPAAFHGMNGKGQGPENTASAETSGKNSPSKKGKLGKRLGRAFSGMRGTSAAAAAVSQHATSPITAPQSGPQLRHHTSDGHPVSPQTDVASHSRMEDMLKKQVQDSTKVSSKGVSSPETILSSIPEGLERGSSCEVIPSHALKPCSGQYRTGKSANGIRVFSSRNHPESESFLLENFHAVDTFADVLQKLCAVYSLDLSTIAIFHDPSGGTIAFNANRALYMNVRFFYALHYKQNQKPGHDCFSYWFTTMAHELAHHLGRSMMKHLLLCSEL